MDFGEYKDTEFDVLDGPVINPTMSPDVIGVLGKDVRMACHVTNLGNKTVKYVTLNCMEKHLYLDELPKTKLPNSLICRAASGRRIKRRPCIHSK